MGPAEKAAQEILAMVEATYKPTHNYVEADPRSFGHLDLAFYEQAMHALCAKGFRMLGDVEDATLASAPGNVLMPVMIRSLISRDGSIMASLYHPRIKPLWLRLLHWVTRKDLGKVVDMETELTDGSFLVTSNAASAAAMDLPALIECEFLPARASVEDVHQRHVKRLESCLQQHPHVAVKCVSTREDAVAAQNRMNALKAAFRGEIGGVSRAELERLSGNRKGFAAEVHDALTSPQPKETPAGEIEKAFILLMILPGAFHFMHPSTTPSGGLFRLTLFLAGVIGYLVVQARKRR